MSIHKELKNKIISIKKTQKITKAMQMVAASKMRKAQQRMELSMPYSNKMLELVGHIANSHSEYRHTYLQTRKNVKAVGYIVVSTDRGLCGSLNFNVFRMVLEEIKKWSHQEVHVELCLFGYKAVGFFSKVAVSVLAQADKIANNRQNLIGGVKSMLNAYDAGKIDKLFIVHNKFINKMVQKPNIIQLLPIELTDDESKGKYWDYIYEPDPKSLLNTIVIRYIESQVYQAIVDNLACEQAARMIAMKNATDSADDFIEKLQLMYNKERQAAITQEIAEIVGGIEN